MDDVNQLQIHVQVHGRHQVFDRSGRLPFSVVFGLCRGSSIDTDPRPLVLDVTRSALDVPYALVNGLLTLHEYISNDKQQVEVDLSRLMNTGGDDATYVILPSPVDRKEKRFKAFTTYLYQIDLNSELASILELGKKYTIRMTTKDLHVRWHLCGEPGRLITDEGKPLQPSGEEILVRSKGKFSAGHARFTVVALLPWPPNVSTRISLCQRETSLPSRDSQTQGYATLLEFSFINEGDRTISIQSRGNQRFLWPWGPFDPEDQTDEGRQRIIADPPESSLNLSSLQIVDTNNGTVVRGVYQPGACLLYDPTADRRPTISNLVTLRPGEPLLRHLDLSKILISVPDGKYRVQLRPRGAWWCFGAREEFADKNDDRVPRRLYKTNIPPVLLESEDVVDLEIENGICITEGRPRVEPLQR